MFKEVKYGQHECLHCRDEIITTAVVGEYVCGPCRYGISLLYSSKRTEDHESAKKAIKLIARRRDSAL